MHYGPRHILGIDLDRELIRKAWSHLRHRYSTLAPPASPRGSEGISLKDRSYFPSCFPRLLGTIPLPPPGQGHGAKGYENSFPRNVRFQTVDWITHAPGEEEEEQGEEGVYDVILW